MYTVNGISYGGELTHYGVLGMKWGIRRYQPYPSGKTGRYLGGTSSRNYKSTSVRSAIARIKNRKVDKSFDKWKENAKRRENAIEIGKTANEKRMAYEADKTNKEAKAAYKSANKEYKKAFRANTTYRKGQVKQEVMADMSRRYMTEANRIKKQLDADPTNKDLQKQYNKLMSQHDIARNKSRNATSMYERRSRAIANMKRASTMAIKGAAATAIAAAGVVAAKKYLNVELNANTIETGRRLVRRILTYI